LFVMSKEKRSAEEVPVEVAPASDEGPEEREVRVVDKRRFARILGFGSTPEPTAEEDRDDAETSAEAHRLPSYVEELRERTERAEAAVAAAAAQARGEVEAARSRLERHYETRVEGARAELVASMLDVFDNLERALEAPGAAESPLFEGVSATRDIFLKKLAALGVEPIETEGARFGPELHEAVDEALVDDEALDGHVVSEYQRGFRIGDRLVRPARVRVARAE
jgi:molecular chaperone GrpE (heat shock protein)